MFNHSVRTIGSTQPSNRCWWELLKGAVRKIIFTKRGDFNKRWFIEIKFLFSSSANRFFWLNVLPKKEYFLALFLLTFISSYCCCCLREEGSFLFQLRAEFSFFLFRALFCFLLFFDKFHVVIQPLFVDLLRGEFDLPLLFVYDQLQSEGILLLPILYVQFPVCGGGVWPNRCLVVWAISLPIDPALLFL